MGWVEQVRAGKALKYAALGLTWFCFGSRWVMTCSPRSAWSSQRWAAWGRPKWQARHNAEAHHSQHRHSWPQTSQTQRLCCHVTARVVTKGVNLWSHTHLVLNLSEMIQIVLKSPILSVTRGTVNTAGKLHQPENLHFSQNIPNIITTVIDSNLLYFKADPLLHP